MTNLFKQTITADWLTESKVDKRKWWKISLEKHKINSVRRALDDFSKGT